METLFEKRPTIKNNRCDKINDNENDNENENENNVENDNDSDDEIESISSTCTWALNYKLPARYVYGKKDENITTVVEEKKVASNLSPPSSPSSSFSAKRTYSDMIDLDYKDMDNDDDNDLSLIHI